LLNNLKIDLAMEKVLYFISYASVICGLFILEVLFCKSYENSDATKPQWIG